MKRHELDPVSLVFGGIFTALGLFMAVSNAHWESIGALWVIPSLLLAMGAIILWSTLRQLRPAPLGDEPDVEDNGNGHDRPGHPGITIPGIPES